MTIRICETRGLSDRQLSGLMAVAGPPRGLAAVAAQWPGGRGRVTGTSQCFRKLSVKLCAGSMLI